MKQGILFLRQMGYPAQKMMSKQLILTNPMHGWCTFRIQEKGSFCYWASLSYLTDVMYDTMLACFDYLTRGASAVIYNREGNGDITVVLSGDTVYIIDENSEMPLQATKEFTPVDFCQSVLDCYYKNPSEWINFANMNDPKDNKDEYEEYKNREAYEIQNMVGNIRTILNAKTGKSSEWVEIMCDHFDQEEQAWCVNAWKRGYDNPEYSTVIAKISVSGEIEYLDEKARQIHMRRKLLRRESGC